MRFPTPDSGPSWAPQIIRTNHAFAPATVDAYDGAAADDRRDACARRCSGQGACRTRYTLRPWPARWWPKGRRSRPSAPRPGRLWPASALESMRASPSPTIRRNPDASNKTPPELTTPPEVLSYVGLITRTVRSRSTMVV